jgi:hypothetical protein
VYEVHLVILEIESHILPKPAWTTFLLFYSILPDITGVTDIHTAANLSPLGCPETSILLILASEVAGIIRDLKPGCTIPHYYYYFMLPLYQIEEHVSHSSTCESSTCERAISVWLMYHFLMVTL